MRSAARGLVTVVGLAAFAARAEAQTGAQPASQPSKRTCFRGRPAATCRAFWLTEAGYYWRLAGSGFVQHFTNASFAVEHLGTHVSWEIGGMVNRGPATALGATLLLGHDNGPRLAVKGRYRRWLPGETTIDLSAGVLKAEASGPYPDFSLDSYGPTADVSLGWGDLVAATARADVLYASGGRVVTAVYAGARLGSYPAVIVTAALATYAAIFLAAILGGGGDF